MDQETLRKLDNATVIKQLTSAASVFAEEGILTPSDADNLRQSLNRLQFDQIKNVSVLAQLSAQNAEFLCLLRSHFGGLGICLNILRFTKANLLNETIANLGAFGEGLLTKAQVLFNRPLFIFLGGQLEKRTLFSSLLVDVAEVVYAACEEIQQAQDQLKVLVPNDLASAKDQTFALDQRIAKEFGFRDTCQDSVPFKTENQAKRKLTGALTAVVETVQDALEQIHLNRPKNDATKTTIVCESLLADAQLLTAFNFPKTDDIEVWEARRLSMLMTILNVNRNLALLNKDFLDLVGKATAIDGATKSGVSKDVIRSVTSNMILDGIPALRANAAACALVRYCEMQKITPKEILVGELSKIDPNLTVSSLELFKELASETTLIKAATAEKKRNLERKDHLLKLFHQKLIQLGVLCLPFLVILVSSCGVKLAPKSSLIDYRPAPHYHKAKPGKGEALPPPSLEDTPEETKQEDEKPQY